MTSTSRPAGASQDAGAEKPAEDSAPPVKPWLVPGALVAAVAGPSLLAVTNAVVGFTPGSGDVESTADVVRLAAAEPGLAELHVWTGLLATAFLVPAVWAVAARLAPRTPRLAAVGGWAMATGYVMSLALTVESMTILAVATSGADPTAYATAVDEHTGAASYLLYGVFGLGALGGGLVLGIAMLRQGGWLPLVAGVALIAAEPVRVAGLLVGVPVGPPLASVLIGIAFVTTVRRSARR